jgi:gliding motility-associated-like protein
MTPAGGNGGYTYTISPSAGSISGNTVSALPKGTYIITLTDSKGCTAFEDTNILEPTKINLTLGAKKATCLEVNNGAAWVNSLNGGAGGYSYGWFDLSTSPPTAINTDLSAAQDSAYKLFGNRTYQLLVSDANNCTQTASVYVGVDYVLAIDKFEIDEPNCYGSSDGIIQVKMANGIPKYAYNWSIPNIGDNAMAVNIPAGDHTVTITDGNGCKVVGAATVGQPTLIRINVLSTPTNCYNGSDGKLLAKYIGGTKPYKAFRWSTSPAQTTDSAINLKAGTYTITITDANDCQMTKTGIVNEPEEFSLSISQQKHITCFGSNDGALTIATKGGTPNYSFIWNTTPPRTTMSIDNLLPNSHYAVTATDSKGCTATISAGIQEPERLELDEMKLDDISCPNYQDGKITIQAKGGTINASKLYEYSLDGINFFAAGKFVNLAKGNYTVWMRDANGCFNSVKAQLVEPEPAMIRVLPSDTIMDLGKTMDLNTEVLTASGTLPKINGYLWFPPEGLSCTDCKMTTAQAYENRTYRVILNYHRNCMDTAYTLIKVRPPIDIFVPNAFTPGNEDGLGVNDIFKVYGAAVKKVTLMVFNRWGEKLYESHNMEEGWDGTYKGEMQLPGVYTFVAAVEYLNGDKNSKKGSVMLIR